MTRDDLLNDMINSILVCDIKCQEIKGGFELSKGNGWSHYPQFLSARIMKKIQQLFYVCFHLKVDLMGASIDLNNQSIPVIIDQSDGEDIISHEGTVKRAINYYQRIGIKIAGIKKYCDSDQEFEDLLLHGIINYLIPVAFGNEVTKKYVPPNDSIKFPARYDDITEQYENAIIKFKNYLLQFRTKKMIRSYGSDMPCISDSRYSLGLCNFAVPLNSTEVGGHFVFTRFSPVYFCLPMKTQEYRKRFEEQLRQESLESDFERLVKGFLKYPFDSSPIPDEFMAKMTFEEDDPSEQLFPLSDIQVSSRDLDINHFYYLTFLDEKEIKTTYPSVTNHSELAEAIKKNAENDFTQYRKQHLEQYYRDTVCYIEDVLSTIQQIDLTELTIGAPDDELACRNALNAFAIDPDDVFPLILEQGQDVLWFTYHLLKRALYEFSLNLITWGDKLGTDVRQYLVDSSLLTKHIQCIDSFLESEPFKSIAEDQVKNIGNDGNAPEPAKTADEVDRTLAEREAYESRVFSHLFADLRSGLENYLSSLRGQNHPIA